MHVRYALLSTALSVLLTACASSVAPQANLPPNLPELPRAQASLLYVMRSDSANRGQLLNVYLEEQPRYRVHAKFMSGEYVALHLGPGTHRVCVGIRPPAQISDLGCEVTRIAAGGVAFFELEVPQGKDGLERILYEVTGTEAQALLRNLRPARSSTAQ